MPLPHENIEATRIHKEEPSKDIPPGASDSSSHGQSTELVLANTVEFSSKEQHQKGVANEQNEQPKQGSQQPSDDDHIQPSDGNHTQPGDGDHTRPDDDDHTRPSDGFHTQHGDDDHTQPGDGDYIQPSDDEHLSASDDDHDQANNVDHVQSKEVSYKGKSKRETKMKVNSRGCWIKPTSHKLNKKLEATGSETRKDDRGRLTKEWLNAHRRLSE
ncbi:MAG: hypothetical protein LQ351_007819 [Letrouitia transgressa]|nr:MAG: hypothetical protein LQ351_007819 [Letrouitia transgressa]